MEANRELLTTLYKHYLVMKAFRFQTVNGFKHAKTDEYTVKYLVNIDKLIETVQGIDSVIDIKDKAHNDSNIIQEINGMIKYLDQHRGKASSMDAILDQMQGDLQQPAYLFGFQ